jgi:hypothetical protein
LPASWFHEVKSSGTSDTDGLHVAMNYWFAPPSQSVFENPYEDDYWSIF